MRYIIATNDGSKILVDEDDYEKFSQYKWQYKLSRANKSYACRGKYVGNYKSKKLYLHREIMNCPKGKVVDHINGNTLDNRKCNLRIGTQRQNTQNSSSREGSTSKYVGVHIHKLTGKWRAQIKINGKIKSLGLFCSQEEAYQSRLKYIEENRLIWFKR